MVFKARARKDRCPKSYRIAKPSVTRITRMGLASARESRVGAKFIEARVTGLHRSANELVSSSTRRSKRHTRQKGLYRRPFLYPLEPVSHTWQGGVGENADGPFLHSQKTRGQRRIEKGKLAGQIRAVGNFLLQPLEQIH